MAAKTVSSLLAAEDVAIHVLTCKKYKEGKTKNSAVGLIANKANSGEQGFLLLRQSPLRRWYFKAVIPIYSDMQFTLDADNRCTISFPSIFKTWVLEVEDANELKIFAKHVLKALQVARNLKFQPFGPSHRWLLHFDKKNKLSSKLGDGRTQNASAASILETANQLVNNTWKAQGRASASLDPLVLSMLRSKWERQKLLDREAEFCEELPVRIVIATWNIASMKPFSQQVISQWLLHNEELKISDQPPLIYVLGLQEIVAPVPGSGFADSEGAAAAWKRAFETSLSEEYEVVGMVNLVGLCLCIVVHNTIKPALTDIRTSFVDNGVLRRNGAVAVSLKIYNTMCCFVNCHLSPHTEKVAERNKEVSDIQKRLSFVSSDGLDTMGMLDHDFVFIFGDMNYRVELSSPTALTLLRTHGIAPLLHKDQLMAHMKTILPSFHEGPILFEPTYKYALGKGGYDEASGRTPSWCDRILYKGKGPEGTDGLKLVAYSRFDADLSDHRSVTATVDIGAQLIDDTKLKVVKDQVLRLLDNSENDSLPTISIDTQEIQFEDLRFNRTQKSQLTIKNIGNVIVIFSVRCVGKEDDVPWVEISPTKKMMMPGDICNLTISASITSAVTKSKNAEWERGGTCSVVLSQVISVMLEEGREYFISISANYRRSIFGSDLSSLLSRKLPIQSGWVKSCAPLAPGVPSLISLDAVVPSKEHWQASLAKHHELNNNNNNNKKGKVTWTCSPSLVIPHGILRLLSMLYDVGKIRGKSAVMAMLERCDEKTVGLVVDALDAQESLQDFSLQALCSCLLLFLRSLPDPLVLPLWISAAVEAVANEEDAFEAVMNMLPCAHYALLVYVISMFRGILGDLGDEGDLLAAVLAQAIVRTSVPNGGLAKVASPNGNAISTVPAVSASLLSPLSPQPTKMRDTWELGTRFVAYLLKTRKN